MNYFGKELAQIRKRVGLTQYQLAKELNLSRSHIFRLESGERKPNKDLIEKISDILKINNYDQTKLIVLANIEPQIDNDNEGFKLCFYLALELKNKGYIERARYLIEKAMASFENMIKLHALLANLNLLNNDYEGAIKANEETLRYMEDLSKSEIKNVGITEAEIIHNLGYVYFERGLEKITHRDKLRVETWEKPNKEIEEFIEELRNEIIFDFEKALEKIEKAFNLELDNLHIVDQLARIYYQKADLTLDPVLKKELFNKSIDLYDSIVSSNSLNVKIEDFKKQEASVFLAVALAKLNKLSEASRIINTVINYKPLYYFGYFAKSVIFSINGKNNKESLETSYNSLVQALKLNTELREYIKLEVDLYNLRFSNFFKEKFDKLYSIQEGQDEEN